MANVISAVGTLKSTALGSGTTTLSINPTAIGDCFVLANIVVSSTVTVSTVSGGNCTWTRIAGPFSFSTGAPAQHKQDLWLGKATATGAANITITGTSSLGSIQCSLCAQQFSSGGGSGTVWAADGTGGQKNNASSTTMTWPTLTPGGTLRAYVGFMYCGQTGTTSGAASGYTPQLTTSNNNTYLYNPNVANSAQSPTALQTPAGVSGGSGVLITATNPGNPGQFMPFFNHHDDELVKRPSGLYVQRKVFGYRGAGRDSKVLVRSAH